MHPQAFDADVHVASSARCHHRPRRHPDVSASDEVRRRGVPHQAATTVNRRRPAPRGTSRGFGDGSQVHLQVGIRGVGKLIGGW